MLTRTQHDTLLKPLRSARVAKRQQSGKTLSYLESWDVRAHLIRMFGFTNFDVEMLEYHHVADRPYETDGGKKMVEVIYSARMQLTIRTEGAEWPDYCRYVEAAVGSSSGPETMLGDHHDNALKTAASDALKRCAINLGTQFGLSLYDDGNTNDVVKAVLVVPPGESEAPSDELTDEQRANLAASLGAKPIEEPTVEEPA